MYIKGASRRSIAFWSRHLKDLKENERAEIIEVRGLAGDNLAEMMREMEVDAQLTQCKNFMYIASFNPRPEEILREEEWEKALDIFEKHRGIPPGQQRIVIEHEKEGRVHRHVVWNRIDAERERAFPDSFDLKVCEAAEIEIENTLGLVRMPHFLEQLAENKRVITGPKSYEMFRGMKTGLDPREVTREVTDLYRQSDSGIAFVHALEEHGYEIVKGNRAYCILDPVGNEHSLARRIDGVNTKQLREFLKDVDLSQIPTVEEARVAFRDRQITELEFQHDDLRNQLEWEDALAQAAIEKEIIEEQFLERAAGPPPLSRTAGEIRLAYSLTLDSSGQAFADAVEDRGMILAEVDDRDAERLNRWERRRWEELQAANAKPEQARTFVEYSAGDLVVVSQRGHVLPLSLQNTGATQEERDHRLGDIDRQAMLSVVEAQRVMFNLRDHQRGERQNEYQQKRDAVLAPWRERHWPIHAPERQGRKDFAQVGEDLVRDKRVDDLHGPAKRVWKAWERELNSNEKPSKHATSLSVLEAKEFAKALDDRGLSFARVSKEEADRSHREAAHAKAIGRYLSRYKEGEIVVITEKGAERQVEGKYQSPRRVGKIDQRLGQKFVKHMGAEKPLPDIANALKASDARAATRQEEWRKKRIENATEKRQQRGDPIRDPAIGAINASRVGMRAGSVLLTGLLKALDQLFAPKLTPEQKHRAQETKLEREERGQVADERRRQRADRAQERAREATEIAPAPEKERELERDR